MFYKLFNKLNYVKKFPYFICTPLIYSLGNASEHIYTAAAYAKIKNKRIIIIKLNIFKKLLKYKICNKELFDSLIINKQSRKNNLFILIINFLIQTEFVIKRSCSLIFKFFFDKDLGEEYRFPFVGSRDLYSCENNFKFDNIKSLNFKECEADLIDKKQNTCLKILEENGIKFKKFVCLHVRDNNYYKDLGRREYRNSSIDNYIDMIKYLIEKDYNVFRLGDKPAPKVKFNHKNFFDVPYTNLKSEIMDLFLIKNCEFYIGTPSGPLDTAYLFNKPVLTTNLYDLYASFPRKYIDRGIFRKIFDKKKKNYLSIKEFANLGIHYHHCENEIKDLIFEENSSQELVEAIEEYYNLIKSSYNKENNCLKQKESQKKFNNFLLYRLKEIYEKDFIIKNHFNNDNWKKFEFIRIIKRFKACEGTFNNSYLKYNFL